MSKRGGDRKSSKYHVGNNIKKNRSLITDFMSTSNNQHLSNPGVIVASNKLNDCKLKLRSLEDNKSLVEENHGKNAIRRLQLEDKRAGSFQNPVSREELEVKLQWMKANESIKNLSDLIDKQHIIIMQHDRDLKDIIKMAKIQHDLKIR